MHLLLSYRTLTAKAMRVTPAKLKRLRLSGWSCHRIEAYSVPYERAHAEARGFLWVEQPE